MSHRARTLSIIDQMHLAIGEAIRKPFFRPTSTRERLRGRRLDRRLRIVLRPFQGKIATPEVSRDIALAIDREVGRLLPAKIAPIDLRLVLPGAVHEVTITQTIEMNPVPAAEPAT